MNLHWMTKQILQAAITAKGGGGGGGSFLAVSITAGGGGVGILYACFTISTHKRNTQYVTYIAV